MSELKPSEKEKHLEFVQKYLEECDEADEVVEEFEELRKSYGVTDEVLEADHEVYFERLETYSALLEIVISKLAAKHGFAVKDLESMSGLQ